MARTKPRSTRTQKGGRYPRDPRDMHVPKVVRVKETRMETAVVKTINIDMDLGKRQAPAPGQFFMLWVPGIDEVPMSLAEIGPGSRLGFAVHNKGDATAALHGLTPGDRLGLRGPYGRGYMVPKGNGKVLVLAGGTGIASLVPFVEVIGKRAVVVLGAKTRSEVLYEARVKARASKVIVTTDDGTAGVRGLVTNVAMPMISDGKEGWAAVVTCGPEQMMCKIVDACLKAGIPVQASLERFMKCGTGICDSCSIGGLQVCKDGPVFDGKTVARTPDFGRFKRDASGKRVPL